ncbi:MAG: FlgD immunoglobulin-like domain containing protein, partial [Ignavibacteriota bacterium]
YGTNVGGGTNTGDVSCSYALETPAASGQWQMWMPKNGFWPANTEGNGSQEYSWGPNLSAPYNRGGAFLPMIRVMVGSFSPGQARVEKKPESDFAIIESYPNPFTPSSGSAQLNFTLSEDGHVSLIIYNEIGSEIRKIFNGKMEKGTHSAQWDGKNEQGVFVHSGIYFCRFNQNGMTASNKILIAE